MKPRLLLLIWLLPFGLRVLAEEQTVRVTGKVYCTVPQIQHTGDGASHLKAFVGESFAVEEIPHEKSFASETFDMEESSGRAKRAENQILRVQGTISRRSETPVSQADTGDGAKSKRFVGETFAGDGGANRTKRAILPAEKHKRTATLIFTSAEFNQFAVIIKKIDATKKPNILPLMRSIFADVPSLLNCVVSAVVALEDVAAVNNVPANFGVLIRFTNLQCTSAFISRPDKIQEALGSGLDISHACGNWNWKCD